MFLGNNVNANPNEQRLEGEAEKRKAQLEWENAAKYTFWGRCNTSLRGKRNGNFSILCLRKIRDARSIGATLNTYCFPIDRQIVINFSILIYTECPDYYDL